MAKQMPPKTRQSGPEAKVADRDQLHKLKPGGPIKPKKQGYVNPGPTDNLRGVEHNTSFHKGTPNPEQHGTADMHGDHRPGTNTDTHGHGVTKAKYLPLRHSDVSTKAPPPNPGDRPHE